MDKNDDGKILVFDLGGGTFDVSILEIGAGVFEVVATAGDPHLGGDDWDQAVIDWLVSQVRDASGADPTEDLVAVQRLKEAAEMAKIELSQATETTANLPFLGANAGGPVHLETTLSRAQFEELTKPLRERLRGPVETALADAKLNRPGSDGGSGSLIQSFPAAAQAFVAPRSAGLRPHPSQLVRPHLRLARGQGLQRPDRGHEQLLKRVKRVAFGFTNSENFRIRALLYAGKPNLRVLDSIVVA